MVKVINEAFEERAKELACLYKISTLLFKDEQALSNKALDIVEIVSDAYRYPTKVVIELNIPILNVVINNHIKDSYTQSAEIILDNESYGWLSAHYFKSMFNQDPFLDEENDLLLKIAQEFSVIIERQKRKDLDKFYKIKLEQKDRLIILGEMAAGIAHELNTPLTNILGYTDLLKDKIDNEDLLRDLTKIYESALFSREVVKKLMYFSTDVPQKKARIDVNKLVKNALNLCSTNLSKANVKSKFHTNCENIEVEIDAVQVTQIIFNLLLNAIYASSSGGKIIIRTRKNKKNWKIAVKDYGMGIDEDIVGKIFDPFFTTRTNGKGLGLGLSVVLGIVQGMNGKIELKNNPGTGCEFIISFPLKK